MLRIAVGALMTSLVLGLVPLPSAAARSRRHRHHTCGTFCRNAGGLGAPHPPPGSGPPPTVAPCRVRTRVIRMDSRVARVAVRCFGRRTSRGAVVIYPHFSRDDVTDGVPRRSYNGADLVVRPGQTVTFEISLSAQAWKRLQRTDFLRVDVKIFLDTAPEQTATRGDIPMALS